MFIFEEFYVKKKFIRQLSLENNLSVSRKYRHPPIYNGTRRRWLDDNQNSVKTVKKSHQTQLGRQRWLESRRGKDKETKRRGYSRWSMTANSRVWSRPPTRPRQNAANNKQYRQLRHRRWTRRDCFPRRFSHTPNAMRTQTPTRKAPPNGGGGVECAWMSDVYWDYNGGNSWEVVYCRERKRRTACTRKE